MKKNNFIESIDIKEIDMEKCYFNPGCAFAIYNNDSVNEILEILNKNFGDVKLHNICCHNNPGLENGSTIINNCAGCDRRFRSLYDGVNTISLWEMLDSIKDLKLPSYDDMVVSVQDSCSFREKPQVHKAIRSLLNKMNIKVVESENSGTNSICCGDSFYGSIPLEDVHKFQKRRALQMPCDDVVVYCVSCIKSMAIGEKSPKYMIDLILNKKTEVGDIDLVSYHDELEEYIKEH